MGSMGSPTLMSGLSHPSSSTLAAPSHPAFALPSQDCWQAHLCLCQCLYVRAYMPAHISSSLCPLCSLESPTDSAPAEPWTPLNPNGVGRVQDHSESSGGIRSSPCPVPSSFPRPHPAHPVFGSLLLSLLLSPGPPDDPRPSQLFPQMQPWELGWGRQLCTLPPLQVPWMRARTPQAWGKETEHAHGLDSRSPPSF